MIPGFLTIGTGDNIPAYTLQGSVINPAEPSGDRLIGGSGEQVGLCTVVGLAGQGEDVAQAAGPQCQIPDSKFKT
jgi:hypothetical protein